jgi:hypothetical protein
MPRNKGFSPEDATWESFILDRKLEPAEPPEYWGSEGYDYHWRNVNGPVKYNPGWLGRGARGGSQIAYYTRDGTRHRIHGPAIINKMYNAEFWLKDGYFHRKSGPAYTHGSTQKWYYDGKLHRLDGPAIIGQGRPKEYWIHGQKLSPKEYKKEISRRKKKNHYAW